MAGWLCRHRLEAGTPKKDMFVHVSGACSAKHKSCWLPTFVYSPLRQNHSVTLADLRGILQTDPYLAHCDLAEVKCLDNSVS